MSNNLPAARTNLELIIREVDALCKGIRLPKKKSRRGRKPAYSDKLILKLVVVQHLLGFTSERSFFRFIPELKCQKLESLPDRSVYNRRSKRLKPITKKLILRIVTKIKLNRSKIRVIDGTSVPVVRLARAHRRKIFTGEGEAAIGYCASQNAYFCGLKLSILVNKDGYPVTYHLMPGNEHDIFGLEWLMDRDKLSNLVIVGDKGYINKQLKERCWRKKSIRIVTQYRKTQKKKNTKQEKKFLRFRKIVETVIGQFKDHMGLERLRAKTYLGLDSRINNLIFTYLFGVYFNILYKRNALHIKDILL